MKSPFHIMIIPTLGCPSRCSYCWSSDAKSPVMTIDTIREIVEWLRDFRNDQVTITFHGGEPLLAGAEYFREALPLLAEGLSHLHPTFALQSNLWLMTPEIADILAEYHIPIGSSLDGPREINDQQRGKGYFDRTMRGYEVAREHDLAVSFICTFTAGSYAFREEIVAFFREKGWNMKIHPALPSLRSHDPAVWALSPADYGDLLVFLLNMYQDDPESIEIMNVNDLVKGVMIRQGTVCTFVDCMDSTYAVGPDGRIYPCYRFVGIDEYTMGHVSTRPCTEDLKNSDAGQRLQAFKQRVDSECSGCRHIRYCRGGCPYNAIAPSGGEINGIDPHCIAYRHVLDEITNRIDGEMYSSCMIPSPFQMSSMQKRGKGYKKSSIMNIVSKIVMR
ncbi:MAG: TIGR04083 family peptide-modifying radical SAM enzyme [Methanomicrobiales archaeon]|nr:TIGR04083 family peptide-modifying radical SAM enzyme [Methanomicrobiales archaeon]